MTHNHAAAANAPQDLATESRRPRRPARPSPGSAKRAGTAKSSKSQPKRAPAGAGRLPDNSPGSHPDTGVPVGPVRIGSPAALLAIVPALLGFEPDQSIVVVGTVQPRAQVRVTLRYDLPDPGDHQMAVALAEHATSVLAAQAITTAVAVGYGPDAAVGPALRSLRDRAAEAGVTMTELLRVTDRRFWSYVCSDPECCPPEGTPFDTVDHPAAHALAAAGGQVLASRDELAATLAAADGELAEAMRQATREAEGQVGRCVARLLRAGMRVSVRRLTAVLGAVAVSDAIIRYRAGKSIGLRQSAWLTVALRELRVRDDAWARMQPEHQAAHLRLWSDLTRLARPGYVAAPASLLAFVAWQSGNGALANIALDRALADNRSYSMALLLRRVLDSGAPPSMARLPMTPEDVAASYDALECESDRPRR